MQCLLHVVWNVKLPAGHFWGLDSTSLCVMTGLAGVSIALAALQNVSAPPIKHLRNMNSHVVAALGDWIKRQHMSAFMPRQASPNATSFTAQMAGTSSMGMSGVNAHLLLSSTEATSGISAMASPLSQMSET